MQYQNLYTYYLLQTLKKKIISIAYYFFVILIYFMLYNDMSVHKKICPHMQYLENSQIGKHF